MGTIQKEVWKCDVCRFEWFKNEGVIPVQCPSRKCRSSKWNNASILVEKPKSSVSSMVAASVAASGFIPDLVMEKMIAEGKCPCRYGLVCDDCQEKLDKYLKRRKR